MEKLTISDFGTQIKNDAIINGMKVTGTIFGHNIQEINADLNCSQYDGLYCFKFNHGSKTIYTVRLLSN